MVTHFSGGPAVPQRSERRSLVAPLDAFVGRKSELITPGRVPHALGAPVIPENTASALSA